MHPNRTRKRRNHRRARGQAMVEYSIINWVLIVALVLGVSVKIFPNPGDTTGDGQIQAQKRNVIEMFLDAYQSYYNSFYFVLNLPFP